MNYEIIKQVQRANIEAVEFSIKAELAKKPTELNSYFEKFLFNKAKRLRPLFLFLLCDFLGIKIDETIVDIAACVELLHCASLIHDDILDDGTLRRGEPCINTTKGNKLAVLAGDYLLALAMEFTSRVNNSKIIKIMSDASYEMTKSEIFSLENRFKKPSLDEYMELTRQKTSTLFLAGVKGIEAVKNIKIDENILKFSEKFSMCFQLKDDINNYLNNDKDKTANDKEQGIYTLVDILGEDNKEDCDIILVAKDYLNKIIFEAEKLLDKYAKGKEELINLLRFLGE